MKSGNRHNGTEQQKLQSRTASRTAAAMGRRKGSIDVLLPQRMYTFYWK
jgi:hypothetical protein